MKNRNLIIYILSFVILGTLMCVYIARGSKQEAPMIKTLSKVFGRICVRFSSYNYLNLVYG